jgi:uncharacterized protein (DUF2147 family)
MKLMTLAASLMLFTSVSVVRAQAIQDSIVGAWESDEKVRMEFFKDGDIYKGKLLWGNKVIENDGQTSKKDLKNPDASLRTRNIIGLVSLTGLRWDGKEYTGGKIYDPNSGKTYSCKAWIQGDKLHLRGFMGLSLMGKTAIWHRHSPDKP